MYSGFVDLEEACNKVCKEELFEALQKYGLTGGLLREIKSLFL